MGLLPLNTCTCFLSVKNLTILKPGTNRNALWTNHIIIKLLTKQYKKIGLDHKNYANGAIWLFRFIC